MARPSGVQNHFPALMRSMRFFLGTGKYTPTAAMSGDMGWDPALVKQWKCICRYWNRMVCMDVSRVNKLVFLWSDQMANRNCKKNIILLYGNSSDSSGLAVMLISTCLCLFIL